MKRAQASEPSTQRVRFVVLNWNGGDMTLRCLDSVEAVRWPRAQREIVLVDNASSDGVADLAEHRRPDVRVVRNPANLGFAGGCNAGMVARDGLDYIALVNNDAELDPTWLEALVTVMERDQRLGAANGKVLFRPLFGLVRIESPTFVPGRGDNRGLGVRLSGVEIDGRDAWTETLLPRGFWGPERGPGDEGRFRWTTAQAELLVPGPRGGPTPGRARLRLAAEADKQVKVSGTTYSVGPDPHWIDVAPPSEWKNVINSAGGELLPTGHGADRGFQEIDEGQYDEPAEVSAWTGSAVLLSRRYLDEVGTFDERLFLYYEDLDLSWRGRRDGWRYAYEPSAIAFHRHSATVGAESETTMFHLERNRLVVVTKNAPARLALRALLDAAWITLVASAREAFNSARIGHGVSTSVLRQRCRFLASYLRLLPGTLRLRLAARQR